MANSFTDLAADIYVAADIVGRELVGFIPSVTINRGSEVAAFGDTVRAAYTREPTLNTAYNPSMTIPEGDDQTVDNKTLTINQVANVQIPYTGEDVRHLDNGVGFRTVYGDQITQAMRKITNAIETHVGTTVYTGGSRAVGAAGTTPFGSNFDVIAEARQVLVDNGCPMDGMVSMVMDTAAGTKLRNLAQLQKANEAGGDDLLRRGVLLDLQGVMLRESAGVASHVAGAGALDTLSPTYLVDNGSGYPIGAEDVNIDTGTGAFKAGDVIQFGGDGHYYVIGADETGGDDTILNLNGPGLMAAIEDGDTAVGVGNYTANAVFHRAAVELVARAPQDPPFGDAADFSEVVSDPMSGLSYRVSIYRGYGKNMIDITTYYQAKVWKEDFVAVLMG